MVRNYYQRNHKTMFKSFVPLVSVIKTSYKEDKINHFRKTSIVIRNLAVF